MAVFIGKRADTSRHRNVYVAEVTFMSGDADHYDHEEIVLGAEEQDVEAFMELVGKIDEAGSRHGYYRPFETEERRNYGYPSHKQPGEDGYMEALPLLERAAFQRFFNMDDDEEHPWIDSWPRDVTCDDIYQAWDGAKIFYYDIQGDKFAVTVTDA
jgi:hypothetical protein